MRIIETTAVEATNSTRSTLTSYARQRKLRANLLLIVVTMIWGSSFLIVQHTLTQVGPFTFLAMRFGFAVLVLALLFRKRLIHITYAEIVTGSVIGLFLFASYAFQTVSLQYTTSSQAGFISGMYVPLVAILAIPLLRQKPTLGGILGILLSLSGLFLLSIKNGFQITIGPGEILALACAFSSALHVISISKFAPKADAINLTIVQITLTALLSLIAMPIAKEPFSIPTFAVWGSALFLGVVATALCLAVMNWVQQFVSGTEAAMFYALELVWISILGHFAGDNLSLLGWIGCGCMLSSMVVGEMRLSWIVNTALLLKFCPNKKKRDDRNCIGNGICNEWQKFSSRIQRATKRRANQGCDTVCSHILSCGSRQLLFRHYAWKTGRLGNIEEHEKCTLDG